MIRIKEEKISPTGYNETEIKQFDMRRILNLAYHCRKLRAKKGFKELSHNKIIIASLGVYRTSLKRRLRNKAKKDLPIQSKDKKTHPAGPFMAKGNDDNKRGKAFLHSLGQGKGNGDLE